MMQPPQFNDTYNICVIDVGSPKSGNLGWCVVDTDKNEQYTGENLDDIFPLIEQTTQNKGLILGLEAPLSVPIRDDLMLATKARKSDGNRSWSAGAGAQVLTINLPIMVYLFNGIKSIVPDVSFYLNEVGFEAKPKQIMIFEAFISKGDKGSSHINDAEVLAETCLHYAGQRTLPPSKHDPDEDCFNLAEAALLRCGLVNNLKRNSNALSTHTPIYKPNRP